jgi:hypothetical protein
VVIWSLLHLPESISECEIGPLLTKPVKSNGSVSHENVFLSFCRRKVTVFSASLAAFTIDHGEKESAGPDMLISFHDNAHYNSVRDKKSLPKQASSNSDKGKEKGTQQKKKVNGSSESTKTNDTAISARNSMSELTMNCAATDEKPARDTQLKSAPCPCGSGQRYKKCCGSKKHAARVQKLKEGSANEGSAKEEGRIPTEEEVNMNGFRVLQI